MSNRHFIIIVGSPRYGFTFYGTFETRDSARHYGVTNIKGHDWWITPILEPR